MVYSLVEPWWHIPRSNESTGRVRRTHSGPRKGERPSLGDICVCYRCLLSCAPMATTRTTFTLEKSLVEQAQKLGVNISAAARQGVASAVRAALAEKDRAAYQRHPELPDPFWSEAEAWSAE